MFIFSLRLILAFLYLGTPGSSSDLYLQYRDRGQWSKAKQDGNVWRQQQVGARGLPGLPSEPGLVHGPRMWLARTLPAGPQHLGTPRCVSGSPGHHSRGPAAPLLHIASCTRSPDSQPLAWTRWTYLLMREGVVTSVLTRPGDMQSSRPRS